MPEQIVAFIRITGMHHGIAQDIQNQFFHIGFIGIFVVFTVGIHNNCGIAGHKIITDLLTGSLCIIVFAVIGIVGVQQCAGRLVRDFCGNDVSVQWIDTCNTNAVKKIFFCSKSRNRYHGDYHKNY